MSRLSGCRPNTTLFFYFFLENKCGFESFMRKLRFKCVGKMMLMMMHTGAGKELNQLLPRARNHPCLTCNTLGDAISNWFLWKSLWKIQVSAATQLLILCTKESLYQAWFSFTIAVLPGNFSGLKPCKFLVALFQ